jgi:hypothetical protein
MTRTGAGIWRAGIWRAGRAGSRSRAGRVAGGQGLVEQQQAGPDGQGPGEGDPLAFAAGQRAPGPGGQGRDAQAGEQRIGAGAGG